MNNFEFDCHYGVILGPLVNGLIQKGMEFDILYDEKEEKRNTIRHEFIKEYLSSYNFVQSSYSNALIKSCGNIDLVVNTGSKQDLNSEKAPNLFRYDHDDGRNDILSVDLDISLSCVYKNSVYHKLCLDTSIGFMTKEIISYNSDEYKSARLTQYRKIFDKPLFFELDTYLILILESGILPHIDPEYDEIINQLGEIDI